jgi:hypothetical protein
LLNAQAWLAKPVHDCVDNIDPVRSRQPPPTGSMKVWNGPSPDTSQSAVAVLAEVQKSVTTMLGLDRRKHLPSLVLVSFQPPEMDVDADKLQY